MLKKFVSLSVLSALLVSTVSCGNATTSLYRSKNSLGDQISANMNKVMNDAERNMNGTATNTYGNRVYTNKISNGYANEYSKLSTDYNYNGVERNIANRTGANLMNSMTPVQKTNTMTTIPARNNVVVEKTAVDINPTARKANTMTTIPVKNVNTVATPVRKTNTINTIPAKTVVTTPKTATSLNTAYNTPYRTVNGEAVTTDTKSRYMSNSVDRVLNSANNTVNNVTNTMTPVPSKAIVNTAPTATRTNMNSTPLATNTTTNTIADNSYVTGTAGALTGSDVSPMIIA